ncbi:hypothetical protein [Rugosimonospora africana]|uniref:Uncharacterized protein n=1 Tax=Rugosimonospora africana TaxID=556532 RepID=A0A8J3QV23_9ACTN|nr:hypothetical protein [Rugosimonospora africana]GIH15351.1 hypothetical protein Raf01_35230 [Rugosimonospora africana]
MTDNQPASALEQTAVGNQVHLFAYPRHRDALVRVFGTVLGCGRPRVIRLLEIDEPVLGFRLPGGGAVSIEFVPDLPEWPDPFHGAWMQITTPHPEGLRATILNAGLPEIRHPGHDFYFQIPSGHVFTVAAR